MFPKTGQAFKAELFSGIVERNVQKRTRNNDPDKKTFYGGIKDPCGAGGITVGQNAGSVGRWNRGPPATRFSSSGRLGPSEAGADWPPAAATVWDWLSGRL